MPEVTAPSLRCSGAGGSISRNVDFWKGREEGYTAGLDLTESRPAVPNGKKSYRAVPSCVEAVLSCHGCTDLR